jgi:predicted nucleic acid-binding protein
MGSLNQALQGKTVYLDTNIFIYALEGVEPWASLLREAFAGMEAREWRAVTSELSLAESLVRPYQMGREDLVQVYQAALSSRDGLILAPLDVAILMAAARLRALFGFKLPDAMHAATAQAHGCQAILTNDAGFGRLPSIQCCLLSDWARPLLGKP